MFDTPVFTFVTIALLYVFFSLCLARIGQRLNDVKTWMAWIPVVQVFYMLRLSQLTYWWFIGLLVPFVNIGIGAWVWARIAIRRERSWWVGALMVVPFVDLFVLAFLAFSKK